MNALRTTLLLGILTGLFLFAGAMLGGQVGLVIAFVFAAVMNIGSYWFSDKIVLKMYRAKEVGENDAPELYSVVREIAQRGQMPMPRVYIVENSAPNAFATGRNPNHAAVAATTGLLNIMNRHELIGVLAHELSHVRHRDTLISAIAATLGGAISMLASMAQWSMLFGALSGEDEEEGAGGLIGSLVMMILAPIAAMLVQMAVSRSREYGADKGGAELTGHPEWLASALEKLERASNQGPMDTAVQHPSTAHMFIINPLKGVTMSQLFSTHPPTEERIKRLRAMQRG
jgi:heat shock protein HtpX